MDGGSFCRGRFLGSAETIGRRVWSLAAGCLSRAGVRRGWAPGPPVSWAGALCGRALSGAGGLPGRLVVLDADAAEGIGEVDGEADGVGLGEFVDKAAAEARGLLVVEVEGVLPQWVTDLQGGVEGVAEGDHPLAAGADDVGGVPCAVAGGEPDVDAGEDL